MKIRIILLVLYVIFTDVTLCTARQPLGLRAASFLSGIPLGTAIRVNSLRQSVDYGQYVDNVKNNYVLVVGENELKSQSIWLGENTYNFNSSDWLLGNTSNSTGWIQQNLMQLRGHNLVWAKDQWIPNWLIEQESSISSAKAKQLLSDYIHTVVGRYRGKIPWWDVINEAVDDNNNTNPFNLRDCFWFRKLGPDFIKYAFIFAHEADSNVKLYYNEYGIEYVNLKTKRTLNLIDWLVSQGINVHGIGLQWHIDVSVNVTPGDVHYQSAQQFVDRKLDFMVTELDVSVPTNGGYPINPQDLQTQGLVYRSILEYALYFSSNCRALLTWGFTDRYSWIPSFSNYTRGAALPLDWMYFPKFAYWQMQETLTRVLVDGIYRLSPQSKSNQCLGTSLNANSSDVQLYNEPCQNAHQKWNITWLGDGTYRFLSLNAQNHVLSARNTTATIGEVQTSIWSDDIEQGWAFSAQGPHLFRIVPRTAWWRVMTVYDTSSIGIINFDRMNEQNWILTQV
ncbi:unnamed protein product [Adineta ricciae]|uniref:endo-1,4-beta-xylanase n=1 Tax=Adineta ricciae TaxID=249248 RepID=A0A815BMX7_ADIRI|nr:unnamed protein product [Adineta ricciae]